MLIAARQLVHVLDVTVDRRGERHVVSVWRRCRGDGFEVGRTGIHRCTRDIGGLVELEIFQSDRVSFCQEDDRLDGVIEFAEVAGPRMVHEPLERRGFDRGDVPLKLIRPTAKLRGDQLRQILAAIPERRNEERQAVDALIQVLAKHPAVDAVAKRRVARRHDADIGAADHFGPEAFEFTVFNRPEDLRLRERAHVGNLVQEQRARIGHLELAAKRAIGAGEGASFVAEELALEQGVVHGRGVEGDERAARASRRFVNRTGEKRLPGPRFAEEEERHLRAGRDVRPLQTGLHFVVATGEIFNMHGALLGRPLLPRAHGFAQLAERFEDILDNRSPPGVHAGLPAHPRPERPGAPASIERLRFERRAYRNRSPVAETTAAGLTHRSVPRPVPKRSYGYAS